MREIGAIIRLQVQRASLKVGQPPLRRYDPAPLLVVAALTLSDGGVLGWTAAGEPVADVHHRDHPASKQRDGVNGISLGFTAHYAVMRARLGAHVCDGLAGENILVDSPWPVDEAALARGLLIETAAGACLRLEGLVAAEPCLPFSQYVLRGPVSARALRATLAFLRHGQRGYYARYAGPPARVQPGDRLWLP